MRWKPGWRCSGGFRWPWLEERIPGTPPSRRSGRAPPRFRPTLWRASSLVAFAGFEGRLELLLLRLGRRPLHGEPARFHRRIRHIDAVLAHASGERETLVLFRL